MKCDKLQRYSLDVDYEEQAFAVPDDNGAYMDAYEVDEAIAELKAKLDEKDKEIAELKDKRLDVKDFAHVLKAFKFYLCQLTHCAYDELTAQWILDNWEQDYKRVEEYKG